MQERDNASRLHCRRCDFLSLCFTRGKIVVAFLAVCMCPLRLAGAASALAPAFSLGPAVPVHAQEGQTLGQSSMSVLKLASCNSNSCGPPASQSICSHHGNTGSFLRDEMAMNLRGGGDGRDWRPESFGKEHQGDISKRKAAELAKYLRLASERGNVVEMKQVLDQGADVNTRDCAGFTPLHITAERGLPEAVAVLVERGAAVDAREDIAGRTALHISAHEGREFAAAELLERGADMEARDDAGSTPFLVAARTGHLAVLKKLAEHGCDHSVTDCHGDSAIRLVEANTRLKPETRQQLLTYLTTLKQV